MNSRTDYEQESTVRFEAPDGLHNRRIITKRLKKRKRKRIAWFIILMLLLFSAIVVCGYLFYNNLKNKVYDVKHIMVVGNETVNSKTVIDAARIPVDSCIFTLNINQVSQNVQERIDCNYLMISKKFPDTIMINIRENPVLYAVLEGETVCYLDAENKVVEISSYLGRTDIPVITGLSGCDGADAGEVVSLKPSGKAEEIRKMMIILNNSDYSKRLSEISVEEDGSLRLITRNNLVIHVEDLEQFKEKYDYIGSILQKNKSNLETDLTLGEDIIVKNR